VFVEGRHPGGVDVARRGAPSILPGGTAAEGCPAAVPALGQHPAASARAGGVAHQGLDRLGMKSAELRLRVLAAVVEQNPQIHRMVEQFANDDARRVRAAPRTCPGDFRAVHFWRAS
jgi:hypothetical protein